MTTNGGGDVDERHAAAIKPWTRIFNIDAGHFDKLTAYAAANTLRIDDLNPHFWRTHDGGKTWTEINTGIAPAPSPTRFVRIRARRAALRRDRSSGVGLVRRRRSLGVAASTTCRHLGARPPGEGRQQLPLRGSHRGHARPRLLDSRRHHAAAAGRTGRSRAPGTATRYLFKPATAVRVRFATNDPTPWPPELPAGENPLPGGLIDYAWRATRPAR